MIFDKQKKSIKMMSARILQKWTIGYTRQSGCVLLSVHCMLCVLHSLFCFHGNAVVSELSEVVGVAVQSIRPTMFGEAHQVCVCV